MGNPILLILIFTLIQPYIFGVRAAADNSKGNTTSVHNELGDNVTKILDDLLKGYDKGIRPEFGRDPVKVGVTMYILSVSLLSEMNMDFTVDFYFRQTWKDPRLKFKGPPGINVIALRSDFGKSIWLPDTFFVNEKRSYYHTQTADNELLRIAEDGSILRSNRLEVTASCPMDLRYFPRDRQLCTLDIESFGYSMADIKYEWAKRLNSVGISSDVSLPEFKVLGHKLRTMEVSLTTGNYSRLTCEIQFERSSGYYILDTYLPSAMLVILSWTAFWINRESVIARCIVGVTTVVILPTMKLFNSPILPKISYITAIDVYLIVCFIMIFMALLESMTVHYCLKHLQRMNNSQQPEMNEIVDENDQSQMPSKTSLSKIPSTLANKLLKFCPITPSAMDKCSRILFPTIFVVFNFIYWKQYISASDIIDDDLILLELDR